MKENNLYQYIVYLPLHFPTLLLPSQAEIENNNNNKKCPGVEGGRGAEVGGGGGGVFTLFSLDN